MIPYNGNFIQSKNTGTCEFLFYYLFIKSILFLSIHFIILLYIFIRYSLDLACSFDIYSHKPSSFLVHFRLLLRSSSEDRILRILTRFDIMWLIEHAVMVARLFT